MSCSDTKLMPKGGNVFAWISFYNMIMIHKPEYSQLKFLKIKSQQKMGKKETP